MSARGRFLLGSCTSAAANVKLFQAAAEKGEPTNAAPNAIGNTDANATGLKLPAPKFAAIASALRPIVRPRRMSAAKAPVLTTVSVVWTILPSLTPRRLIQVRIQIVTRAISR